MLAPSSTLMDGWATYLSGAHGQVSSGSTSPELSSTRCGTSGHKSQP